MSAIRDKILGCNDTKYKYVEISEWDNCQVKVRSLSISQMEAVELNKNVKENAVDGMLRLVIACVVDEDGKQALTLDDITALKDKSADALKKLIDGCIAINKLSNADAEALKKN